MNINDFVYLSKSINENGITIEKNSVGIIQAINNEKISVLFMASDNPITFDAKYAKKFDVNSVGDDYNMKICNRCHKLLPVDKFDKNQTAKDNKVRRRPSCKECRVDIDGRSIPTRLRRIWDCKKPHLVWWTCPVCHKKTIPDLTSKVVLDHNHHTGIPRAWICDSCNTGIGRFQDNVDIVLGIAEYLKSFK